MSEREREGGPTWRSAGRVDLPASLPAGGKSDAGPVSAIAGPSPWRLDDGMASASSAEIGGKNGACGGSPRALAERLVSGVPLTPSKGGAGGLPDLPREGRGRGVVSFGRRGMGKIYGLHARGGNRSISSDHRLLQLKSAPAAARAVPQSSSAARPTPRNGLGFGGGVPRHLKARRRRARGTYGQIGTSRNPFAGRSRGTESAPFTPRRSAHPASSRCVSGDGVEGLRPKPSAGKFGTACGVRCLDTGEACHRGRPARAVVGP